jgi:hypothetical protein
MRKNKLYKLLTLFLVFVMICSLVACGGDTTNTTDTTPTPAITANNGTKTITEVAETDYDTEWAIYWYLCGSDLESGGGSASIDIYELMDAPLPENVKIIIQTGGSSVWQNDFVDPNFIERYVYDSTGLTKVEQQPLTSMGDEETLSSFLDFAKTNYPANKTMFLLWNHGGGTVHGAASDELFGGDALDLQEMHKAFQANYELTTENPPFDIIGFDTCLMATVDVAATFSDIGSYLVASQEIEPGNGWNYTGWATALAANPAMDAKEFGTIICDTYQSGCELVGTQDSITLSLTNLSKISSVLAAYEDFGKEALANACIDPSFFSFFGRVATVTENYGGNTKEQGFTNMVDLGHLARQSAELLPTTSNNILTALGDCVEYKVSGPYRHEATGLSCYYSLNGDVDDYIGYVNLGVGEAFKYFYAYSLTGELTEDGMKYISEMNYETIQPLETLETQGWENHPLDVDSEGAATLTLGEKAANILSGMYIQLYYLDIEQDLMLLLGSDNDLNGDWETGVFKDNFRGVWGALDGHLVNMELSYEGEGYNLYAVPVLINGEEYNLIVVYDYETASYTIQGARKPVDESGMADKNLYYLIEGDVIKTIHYAMSISGEGEEFIPVEIDEIIWDNNMTFEEIELGDGVFMQMFEMRDMQGYSAYSDAIMFETVDGVITTTVGFTE